MTGPDPLTINEQAHGDHPHEQAQPDTRTDLQRAEDAEREAFEALPVTGKVEVRARALLDALQAQQKVNGPVTSRVIELAQEILALVH